MPHDVDAVNRGLVALQMARLLRPVHTPANPARPPCPSLVRLLDLLLFLHKRLLVINALLHNTTIATPLIVQTNHLLPIRHHRHRQLNNRLVCPALRASPLPPPRTFPMPLITTLRARQSIQSLPSASCSVLTKHTGHRPDGIRLDLHPL